MSTLRLTLIFASLVGLAACGTNYSSAPGTTPTPTPTMPAPTTPAAGGASASVAIPAGAASLASQAFPPNPLTIDTGTTVTWVNKDSIAHTSTSNAPGWDSGILAPGAQFSTTFNTSGTFQYHCQIHPGMVGTVVVR